MSQENTEASATGAKAEESFIASLLTGPSPEGRSFTDKVSKKRDAASIVTTVNLTKGQVRVLCSAKLQEALTDINDFNSPNNLCAGDDAAMLSKSLATSIKEIHTFIAGLHNSATAQTDGVTLPSDALPQHWREDIAQARSSTLALVKKHAPQVAEQLKSQKRASASPPLINDLPEPIIDAVAFITMLDKASAILSTVFPNIKNARPEASEYTILKRDDCRAFNDVVLFLINEVIAEHAPEMDQDETIQKVRKLVETLGKTDSPEIRIAKADIPCKEELEAAYEAIRSRLQTQLVPQLQTLMDEANLKNSIYFQPSLTRDPRNVSVSQKDIALLVADQQYARTWFANGHQPEAKHDALRKAIYSDSDKYPNLLPDLEQCCNLDECHHMLQRNLDKIHQRMERAEANSAGFGR